MFFGGPQIAKKKDIAKIKKEKTKKLRQGGYACERKKSRKKEGNKERIKEIKKRQ